MDCISLIIVLRILCRPIQPRSFVIPQRAIATLLGEIESGGRSFTGSTVEDDLLSLLRFVESMNSSKVACRDAL